MSIDTFYRFRSIENLLGEREELEKQSIFFAPPHLLNDPVEGFKDIYWQGDRILWTNLFNHYLLCLMKWCVEFLIIGDEFDLDLDKHFDACVTVDDLHENFQAEFSIVSENFIRSEHIQNLIDGIYIYRESIGENELELYFRMVHSFALYCIYERLEEISAVSDNVFKKIDFSYLKKINDTYFQDLKDFEAKYGEGKVQEFQHKNILFFAKDDVALAFVSRMSKFRRKIFTTEFASLYVQQLERLMFPDWFTACFMSDCTNSSVWGHYGKNHTGVCMVFSAEVDSNKYSYLSLNSDIKGWNKNGVVKGKSPFKFFQIEYEKKYEPINFFKTIGQLPKPLVYRNWYSWNRVLSPLAESYNVDWGGEQYWDNFYKSVTKKTNDWKYENEYRLLICDMNGSYSQESTTLQYDFKSLKGIIFGIKTSDEDKWKIIELIEKKVSQYSHYEFCFYQAYYCRDDGNIKHYEISSLKFERPENT
ncbi:DUF2971 domain-containing protein [Marinomonas sp. NPDC078689]|uniref:DUF2971 domain-containing protein n=1 Tax=Marinomonas sp. NPDC078689 TaxID=3364147 RepID=UPI0037C89F38